MSDCVAVSKGFHGVLNPDSSCSLDPFSGRDCPFLLPKVEREAVAQKTQLVSCLKAGLNLPPSL